MSSISTYALWSISILDNFTNHDLYRINTLLKVTLGEYYAW